MPSVQDPIAGHIAASMHAQTPVAQSEGNGAVIVDLDEAIFGLNALARELFGIAQSGIGQAAVHWQQEAATMGLDPMSWISASAYESDWSAIVSTVVVSAVSLPFAALAIKGGIDEIRHGRAERQRLRLERELLMARHERAAPSPDGADTMAAPATKRQNEKKTDGIEVLARGLAHKDAARLERIGPELSAANATVSIGAAATSSGSFMSVNALSEILLQPILKCCSQGAAVVAWIAQHAVWSTIVSVVGSIGTFVLAPLAALSATWLGSSFVHRSRIKCREFLHAKGLLTAAMKGAGDTDVSALPNTPYGRFLTAKLGKRAVFMLKFRNWSIGFLSGASTYTGGVLAKTALLGAALLGVGIVATNPILLVALSIAVTIGAIVMAVGSVNFIVNLGKVKRHEGYENVEHPQLDRELFDAMDPISQAGVDGGQSLSQRAGFKERAKLYGEMVAQETEIQKLVQGLAVACHKRYEWTDRSDIARYSGHRSTSAPASRGKDFVAALRAAGVLMRGLLSGKGPARSVRAAGEHYAGRCSALTVHTLAQALASADPVTLRKPLYAIAEIQSKVLEARLATRKRLIEGDDKPGDDKPSDAGVQEVAGKETEQPLSQAAEGWLEQQLERQAVDFLLLAELQEFKDAPRARVAAAADPLDPANQARLAAGTDAPDEASRQQPPGRFIARFLQLQHKMGLCAGFTKPADKTPDAATQYAELAGYLLTQAPKGFASLRGSLLACEMDAARASAMPAK